MYAVRYTSIRNDEAFAIRAKISRTKKQFTWYYTCSLFPNLTALKFWCVQLSNSYCFVGQPTVKYKPNFAHFKRKKYKCFQGGQGGKLSVTCGTPADSTTTQLVFTVTTSSTIESKFQMQSNIGNFLFFPHNLCFVLVFLFNKSVF